MPLYEVNEDEERFSLFNNYIQLNGKHGFFKIGDETIFMNSSQEKFNGRYDTAEKNIGLLTVHFSDAQVEVFPSSDASLHWTCSIGIRTDESLVDDKNAKQLIINLQKSPFSQCRLEVPLHLQIAITGVNLNGKFHQMNYPLDINAQIGKISLQVKPELNYNFDIYPLSVQNGNFLSSKAANAYPIKIQLIDGEVKSL
ncbi:MAG: hypothetical protein JNM93_14050 [Bacteriovoracaceae bacterium]|nr:hypothetical protein [Bacteriovoracaceae bacterium]